MGIVVLDGQFVVALTLGVVSDTDGAIVVVNDQRLLSRAVTRRHYPESSWREVSRYRLVIAIPISFRY